MTMRVEIIDVSELQVLFKYNRSNNYRFTLCISLIKFHELHAFLRY